MKNNKAHILYIDDEVNNLVSFKANFRNDYQIYTAESATEGLKILQENNIHIIITDQRMPTITGVRFLESIIEAYPDSIRMLLTGYTDIEAVIEAINKGQIFRYIVKPWNRDELKQIIDSAFELYSYKENNKNLLRRYRKVFETSKDVIFLLDKNGLLIDFNDAATELLLYSRAELIAMDVEHLADNFNIASLLAELNENGFVNNTEIKLTNALGQKLDCLLSVNKVNEKQSNTGYLGMIKDITKHKEYRNMTFRSLMNEHESKRENVAKDLHDSLAQQLAGIKFYMHTIANSIENVSLEKISEKMADSAEQLNSVFNELRQICFDLMPRTLIEFGLSSALKDLCSRLQIENNQVIQLFINDDYPRLNKIVEITAFRIIQEFIMCGAKYDEAGVITIKVEYFVNNSIVISLNDFSKMIDINHEKKFEKETLNSIKSKAEIYNGIVKVDSGSIATRSYKITMPLIFIEN